MLVSYQRSLPDLIQNVLNDVGEQITGMLKDPTVSRAMGIIGKRSGEVRADKASIEKVANKVFEASPLLEKALEYFDLTPIEGLRMLNDPLVGPLIQGVIQGGLNPSGLLSIPQGHKQHNTEGVMT